jgi:splicing factor 3B subunit 1
MMDWNLSDPSAGASPASIDGDLEERNRPLTDKEIDDMLPPTEEYAVISPPEGYKPPKPPRFSFESPNRTWASSWDFSSPVVKKGPVFVREDLPLIAQDDLLVFQRLVDAQTAPPVSEEDKNVALILEYLLLIKCGTEEQRKSAGENLLRQINIISTLEMLQLFLTTLMSPTTTSEQSEHISDVFIRVIREKDDLLRPYAHKIFVIIEPLLIEQLVSMRDLGRRLIAVIARAVGLATVIAVMRPDIDASDEFVRAITAKALAVVAAELGVDSLLPFLTAICSSAKSPLARHCGIKTVKEIADLMKQNCWPHLENLLCLLRFEDDEDKVRTISLLTLSSLAEAVAPNGTKEFSGIITPLWKSLQLRAGHERSAAIKACGRLLRVLPDEVTFFYASELIPITLEEAASKDDSAAAIGLEVLLDVSRGASSLELFKDVETFEIVWKIIWGSSPLRTFRLRNLGAQVTAALFTIARSRVLETLKPALDSSHSHFSLALEVIKQMSESRDSLDTEGARELAQIIVQRLESTESTLFLMSVLDPLSSFLLRLSAKTASPLAQRASAATARLKLSTTGTPTQVSTFHQLAVSLLEQT